MPPRAVLFDFDGVLVDTENIHVAAWQRTLTRIGWELSDEAAAPAAEIDDRIFLAQLFAARKIENPDLDGWIKIKQSLAESMLADDPQIYPGVVPLIQSLRSQGVRLGIVTTTWQRNVTIVLKATGLTDAFEVVIAKEDVAAVKPAPDGYLSAIEYLGLEPADAIAIEDSPTGAESARAAGLRVLAVGHRRPPGDWSGASFLPNLSNLDATLNALGLE
jgi:beta-phosphoglucomutase